MKKSTKVLIGIGATALIGTTIAVVVSDTIVTTVKQVKDRRRVKQFVQENLRGNEKILEIVDDLTSEEINSLVGVLDKIKQSKDKIFVTGNTVREATEEAKRLLVDFVEGFAQ